MGIIGGDRHYDGSGIAKWAPWKCPSCGVDNAGEIDGGCTSCGSGSAQARHVGVQPPVASRRVLSDEDTANRRPSADAEEAAQNLHLTASFAAVKADMKRGLETMQERLDVSVLAEAWVGEHDPDVYGPAEAFIAGYQLAMQHAQARTMVAPPVTADLTTLAPEGKTRRTIIAALDLFKDQVLREATEEIASGEWCSIEEVEQLITQLKQEEGSL